MVAGVLMASPTLSGATVLADPSATSDRTLTAPAGVSDGDTILVAMGGQASKPVITLGWTGTAGSGDWVEMFAVDKTSTTDHGDTWTGTADSGNANFYKVHTSNSRALVWIAAVLGGADSTAANWASVIDGTGAGTDVSVSIPDAVDSSLAQLAVAVIVSNSTTATDPSTLPDSWAKVASGISGPGSGASYLGVFARAVAAGETPSAQTFAFGGAGGAWETLTLLIPAASGGSPVSGTVTGAVLWTGAVSGTTTRTGATAGSLDWTGAVSGTTKHSGAVGGAVSWTGAVTGRRPTPTGSVAGTVAWAGNVSGRTAKSGAVAGGVAWAGTVGGSTSRSGAIAGHVAWTGSIHTPTAGPHGAIAGTVRWTGAVTGSRATSGAVTGLLTWAGSVSGGVPGAPGTGIGDATITANTASVAVTSASAVPSFGDAVVSSGLADVTLGSN